MKAVHRSRMGRASVCKHKVHAHSVRWWGCRSHEKILYLQLYVWCSWEQCCHCCCCCWLPLVSVLHFALLPGAWQMFTKSEDTVHLARAQRMGAYKHTRLLSTFHDGGRGDGCSWGKGRWGGGHMVLTREGSPPVQSPHAPSIECQALTSRLIF